MDIGRYDRAATVTLTRGEMHRIEHGREEKFIEIDDAPDVLLTTETDVETDCVTPAVDSHVFDRLRAGGTVIYCTLYRHMDTDRSLLLVLRCAWDETDLDGDKGWA